jgi:hypothetical protein
VSNLLTAPSSAGGRTVNVRDTAKKAASYLATTGDIFRKGSTLLRLIDGQLAPLSPSAVHTLIFDRMRVMRLVTVNRQPQLVPATDLKDSVLRAIRESHFIAEFIPEVTVVAPQPYLVLHDGQLVMLTKGYNKAGGGVLVTGGTVPPKVPIDEAVQSIFDLLTDFQFATTSDKSRAVAAIFSAAMHLARIYERNPLLVFEADQSQTGKTLLFNIIVAMFGQRCGVVAQKQGGVGSRDESIMQRLVQGFPFVLLDNARGAIDSPFLEACLTPEGGFIEARILRETVPVDPRPVIFGMTSNAAQMTKDLANRSLLVRLRKQSPGYQFKPRADADGHEVGLRRHVESQHAYYQGCVNAVVLDWWKNGAQRQPCPEHDFRESMGALDNLVQHYFKLPPLLDGHQIAVERTANPGMSWVRQIALLAAQQWHVVDWKAAKIADRCMQEGIAIPGVNNETESKSAAQAVGIAMASAFGSKDTFEIEGVEVRRAIENDKDSRQHKIYTFTKVAS